MAVTRPGKRKLAIPQEEDAVELDSSPFKRVRQGENDDLSDCTSSTVPSLAVTATATLANTTALLTESSGSRSKTRPRAKKFICQYPGCDKAFDRPIRLQVHHNTHTGERPHTCPHDSCDKSFFKASHLKAHVLEKHTEQRDYVCTFLVHSADNGGTVSCGRAFPTSTKLKRHVAQHEEKEETTCSWEGCGKVFRKQETLQRHIKKEHLDELPYLCTHDITDGGSCGQSFSTPGLLRSHIAHQHSSARYWCEICTDASAPEPSSKDPTNDLDDAFLPTADDLRQGVEPDLFNALSLEDASSHDQANGRVSFATFSELQLHNRLVHPPTCSECGKQCKSNRDLSAHVDIYHSAVESESKEQAKTFLCPVDGCPRSHTGNGFSRKGNMDVHIKTVHTKEKSFVCGEHDLAGNEKVMGWNGIGCHLALGTKQALVAHIRTQHLGIEAATGVKTGLRKSVASKRGRPKKNLSPADGSLMDIDTVSVPPPAPNTTLAMLTGAGYEDIRPLPCLLAASQGCQVRFTRQWDLATHLELTHGWQVDDVQEAIARGGISLAGQGNDDRGGDRGVQVGFDARPQTDGADGFSSMGMLDPQLQGMVV